MIKLIINEFYKVFHKKSTYILIGILSILIVGINILNNTYNESYSYNSWGYIDTNYIKEELNNLDQDSANYLNEKARLETDLMLSDIEKELSTNWQVDYLYSNLYSEVNNYYNTLYIYENEEEANQILNNINEYKDLLIKNDYTEILSKELRLLEIELEELNDNDLNYESEINVLEYKIDILNKFIDTNTEPDYNNYLYQAYTTLLYNIEEFVMYENMEKIPDSEKEYYNSLLEHKITNEYILNNEADLENNDLQYMIKSFISSSSMFIAVFIIMIAANILSNEYSKGTIKTLLLAPYSRTKILLSKFIVTILMIPFIIIILFIVQLISGGIIFGFDSLSIPVVTFVESTKTLQETSVFIYLIQECLLHLPLFIFLTLISFTLTAIFPSASFAIVISLLAYITYPIINAFITYYDIEWLKYFISIPWEYFTTYYRQGVHAIEGVNTIFASVMCLIYFIIFLATSIIFFNKKDVKNI